MTRSVLRRSSPALVLAGILFAVAPLPAQELLTTSDPDINRRAMSNAPVGHRQPRAADIPAGNKTEAEILEERQQAELNRRLRICRGC